jgi:hypothetical protein
MYVYHRYDSVWAPPVMVFLYELECSDFNTSKIIFSLLGAKTIQCMYFNISLTVRTGLCSRINKLTTHTCAHYITVLCDKPQSTNHMIRSAHADQLTAINVRKQILTEPFILLFNARPSDDTVLYTAHCDVVLIIQTVNRRIEIS